MTNHRTIARGILFLILAALSLVGVGGASAGPAAATHGGASAKVPRFVFPVVGAASFINDFGDARGQGSHEGNDIMAPRKALVVAAEAGTVKFWTTSSRAGCMLYLYGKSGTTYLYIHLNNDLGNGNDNKGSCVPGVAYAPGLKNGARVAAGQHIAYNGDSGDADGINPHLHFEVRPGDGGPINPYAHLKKAQRLLFAATPGTTFTLALTGRVAAAAEGQLALQLEQLRQWPGGRKVQGAGQKVAVTVPDTAVLEGGGVAAAAAPTVEQLAVGSTVTVWTAPAKVTLAAQTGSPGALAAERVVLKRSGR